MATESFSGAPELLARLASFCRLRGRLAPGARVNAWNQGTWVGVHASSQLRRPRSRTRNFVHGAGTPEAPKAPLLYRGARSSGWDPGSLFRLDATVRGGSKRKSPRERDRWAGPEEGALPAGGGDAHGLCTWRSLEEPTSRGMPKKRWEGGFRHRTQKLTGLRREGHSHCCGRGTTSVVAEQKSNSPFAALPYPTPYHQALPRKPVSLSLRRDQFGLPELGTRKLHI